MKRSASLVWVGTLSATYRALLDEVGVPIGVQQKLMRHSNIATTMNVYGNASLKAKQKANSQVVRMLITQGQSQTKSLWQHDVFIVGFCGVEDQREACKLLIYWLLR